MNAGKKVMQDIYGHKVNVMEDHQDDGKLHVVHEHVFGDEDQAEGLKGRLREAYGFMPVVREKNKLVVNQRLSPRMPWKALPIVKPAPKPVVQLPAAPKAAPKSIQDNVPEHPMDDIENRLKTLKVLSSHPLGRGGINDAQLVNFEDGTKGVFKRHEEVHKNVRAVVMDGYQTERETAAYKVAKVIGMQDLVVPAVDFTLKGQRGTLLPYINAKVANMVGVDEKFDGERDQNRAAAFDYVIGNTDRHSGNWLVGSKSADHPEGHLRLIDHGLAFPDKTNTHFTGRANDAIVKYVVGQQRSIPQYVKDMWANHKSEVLKTLKDSGIRQQAIDGVEARIDHLAKTTNWNSLK